MVPILQSLVSSELRVSRFVGNVGVEPVGPTISFAVVAPGASISPSNPTPTLSLPLPIDPSSHIEPESSSRFHIKQRVLCGSTSMRLPRVAGQEETHKWMVYVRAPNEKVRLLVTAKGGPSASAGDVALSKFISKVRFFIHPSFKPEDIVEVTEPPFQITRFGYLFSSLKPLCRPSYQIT